MSGKSQIRCVPVAVFAKAVPDSACLCISAGASRLPELPETNQLAESRTSANESI